MNPAFLSLKCINFSGQTIIQLNNNKSAYYKKMELNGKLIKVLPEVKGESKNGPWRKQDFIIETLSGDFPKKVCITLWGDKIKLSDYHENDQLKVSIDIESREYNGRWYTDVKAWRIERTETASGPTPEDTSLEDTLNTLPEPEDDLPF